MSVRKKNSAAIRLAASYILPVLCGFAVSAVLSLLAAGVMYALGMPPSSSGFLSFAALAAGAFTAGLLCGLIRRRGGLKRGALCSALFLVPLLIISALTGNLTGEALIAKALSVLMCSCTGAVIGVNAHR